MLFMTYAAKGLKAKLLPESLDHFLVLLVLQDNRLRIGDGKAAAIVAFQFFIGNRLENVSSTFSTSPSCWAWVLPSTWEKVLSRFCKWRRQVI